MTHLPEALFDALNVSFVCTNLHFTFNVFLIQTSTLSNFSTRTTFNMPPSSSSDEDEEKVDHDVRRLTVHFSDRAQVDIRESLRNCPLLHASQAPSYRFSALLSETC